MSKELEAIEALGFEYEILRPFSDKTPVHKFKRVHDDRFATFVFVGYGWNNKQTIRAVLHDYGTGEVLSAALTGDETEAFLAFLRAIEKGDTK